MSKSQCKGCQDRRVGCHGSCEKYKAFQEENRKVKEWLRDQNGQIMPANVTYNTSMKRYETRPRGINWRERTKVKGGAA